MLKRIFSLMLALSLTLTVVFISAKADTPTENENAVKLLEKLQVIYEKNNFEYESGVSRADFAVYAARVMGIDDTIRDDETRYYIDMATYDYAAYSVNTLVERGILSVGDNKLFRPSDAITYEEAVKMVVCMIGYKSAAEARGGFPTGYIRLATQLGLSGGASDEVFSLNDAAMLLYRTLITPQYMVNSITIDGEENTYGYYESDDFTLLYEVFGYRFAEGVLTGYDGINIAFDVTSSENMAVVDNVLYSVKEDIDLTDYIGSNVCILYDDDDTIHYAYAQEAGEKITEIDVRDFVSYDGSKLVYSVGDKGNKSIDVSSAVVIYNGAAPETGIKDLLGNLESGTVKVVNSDGKGAVEAIVVTDYKAYVYKSADVNNNIIFSKIDGQSGIELDKYARVEMINTKGEAVTLDELEANMVMNVVAATDYSRIKIIVSESKVSGTVTQIKTGDKPKIELDGISYGVNKAYKSIVDEINPGQKVTVLLNLDGEAVMITEGTYESLKVGYLSGLTLDSGGVFDTGLKFRIFSKDSGIVTYSSASNIRIDGIKYDSAKAAANNIPDTICDGSSIQFKSQIIQYKLNADNEISYVDTHKVSAEENPELTLCRLTDGTSAIMKYNGRFDKMYPVNSNTDVYCVPAEDSLSSNPNDYFIAKQNNFNAAVSFKMELYKLKGENEFIDAAIYHTNPADTELNDWLNSNIFLVGEVSEAIDKNDEHYKLISGLQQGSERKIEVYDTNLVASSDSVADLTEGDLIRYRTAQNGKVIHIQKIYDESTETRLNWAADTDTLSLFDTGFNSNFQLSFGYVNKKGEKVVSWGYKSGANVDEALDLSAVKFMFYDRNQREGSRLYTGTLDSIIDYESAGDNCDIIILQTVQTSIRAAVIYKR